jgi:D-glycero-beta-D-manno-heptose 1-phosphate adenylyltransferase
MHKLEVLNQKILKSQALEKWLYVAKFKTKVIAFTNGCFDILHRGHIEYLAQASELSDLLIVGLNTDASVKRLKGPSRPYLDENARALILASLSFVSAVVLFDEDTPYELIKRIQPDFLIKGGDYKPEDIAGYDIVTGHGGQVVTIPLTQGYSSTKIIDKIAGKY